jgi:molybdate transport system substrate-binding protein
MLRARLPLLALGAVTVVLAGCSGGDGSSSGDGSVTVFAAASLTDAFTAVGAAFGAATPGSTVTFNFGASSSLATQIEEGSPADVFAAADEATMTELAGAGVLGSEPSVFTTNAAEIIVAPGNPLGITGVADLANPEFVVVACAPAVPCGRYTATVLDRAGVTVTPRSLEENVRGVVSKVLLGEADAGIVYRTDVLAAGNSASGVAIPDETNVVARYPIAVVAFVDFVRGPEGQRILATFGFVAP